MADMKSADLIAYLKQKLDAEYHDDLAALAKVSGKTFKKQTADTLVTNYGLPRATAEELMNIHEEVFPGQCV